MNRLERIVPASSGHPAPDFNRFRLQPIDLAHVTYGGRGDDEGDAEFVIRTPEVRCRVRVTIMLAPLTFPPGATGDVVDRIWNGHTAPGASLFGGTQLWVAKRDEPGRHSGESLPVENIVGSYASYRPGPDPGCLGFTFDFESCNDEVWGRLHVDASAMTFSGVWVLRASIVGFQGVTPVEWDRVTSRFEARVVKALNLVGHEPL
jgi:hypothetical protein